MWQNDRISLVLASASMSRASLLHDAGIAFTVMASDVDEQIIKDSHRQQRRPAAETALCLAHAKGIVVSTQQPEAVVIAADQMLEDDKGLCYDKPASMQDARQQLRQLRGKRCVLPSATVLYHKGKPVWEDVRLPTVTFRSFSDDFLEAYCIKAGSSILRAVGACAIEQEGAALLQDVNGDYPTIRGLPLLAVLTQLRLLGVLGE